MRFIDTRTGLEVVARQFEGGDTSANQLGLEKRTGKIPGRTRGYFARDPDSGSPHVPAGSYVVVCDGKTSVVPESEFKSRYRPRESKPVQLPKPSKPSDPA